jgi:tight adherence protein B
VAPALDALARSLAGGTGLARALDSLIDRRNESTRPFVMALGVARRRHRLGVPLAAAFADARSTMAPTPETDLALTALEAAARHGGAQAGALDRAAFAVRQRRTVVAERAAHSAQARLSALVLSLLPPAFAMWSISTNHRVARFLLASPAGWLCTVGGVALNALGWRWMRRLVRSDE